ncbi:MAG TPA: EamA family transporter [Syntrophomonadaceae bacterium]|nr:EamA family transporter [Syntrophomonadaceae bacterium]
MSTKFIGYLFIAIAAALWGSFSVISKVFFNNAYFDPIQITQIRALGSGVTLLVIMFAVNRKELKIDIKSLGVFFLLGLTIIHLQLSLLFAIKLTDVSIASFLQYLAPALIFAYSVIFHQEPVHSKDILILGLAIAGVVFLIASSCQDNLNMAGIMSGLWTAVALSVYTLYSKIVAQKHNTWTALTYGMLSVSLLLLVLFPPSIKVFDGFPYNITLFLLYISLFTMIIPYGLFLLGMRFIKPHQASITATLEPVVALVLSVLLSLEILTPIKLMGCLFIISSVILLTYQNITNKEKTNH